MADALLLTQGKETAMKVIVFRMPRFLAKILIKLRL
jgi:hypothetical protein